MMRLIFFPRDSSDEQQQEKSSHEGLYCQGEESICRPDEQNRDNDNSQEYQEDGDELFFATGHVGIEHGGNGAYGNKAGSQQQTAGRMQLGTKN